MEQQESVLQRRYDDGYTRYAGLIDIDLTNELAAQKLLIVRSILDAVSHRRQEPEVEPLLREAQHKAREALELLERIRSASVPEEDRELMRNLESHRRTQRLFEEIVLRGGAVLFEGTSVDPTHRTELSRIVARAIRKHLARDDAYEQLLKTERMPSFLRTLVRKLFPVFESEGQADPPHGFEDGEEQQYCSERMTLPLSQAILYLEEELLPDVERRLAERPGDPCLQSERDRLRQRIASYREISFTPRSTPVLLEKGFYTEWLTGFSQDGEMLVTVDVPTSFGSGSNLDRMRELVIGEIVRNVAGKEICPELDREYRYLRQLQSGMRGSSRIPSFKLDPVKCFSLLKRAFPAIGMLEDRARFRKLIDRARKGSASRRELEKAVRQIVFSDSRPPLLDL